MSEPSVIILPGHTDTENQFKMVVERCRATFEKKLCDYGASWRILRPSSITDYLFIKTKRIRFIECGGEQMVQDNIESELKGLVNYGFMGLIQLERGYSDVVDMTPEQALEAYDAQAEKALELMRQKNNDYNEAWRDMRTTSYTDFILTKVNRIKEIEAHEGVTQVSEGIDSNYLDIINYAVFGLIKIYF